LDPEGSIKVDDILHVLDKRGMAENVRPQQVHNVTIPRVAGSKNPIAVDVQDSDVSEMSSVSGRIKPNTKPAAVAVGTAAKAPVGKAVTAIRKLPSPTPLGNTAARGKEAVVNRRITAATSGKSADHHSGTRTINRYNVCPDCFE
jgi:hypothetical protein